MPRISYLLQLWKEFFCNQCSREAHWYLALFNQGTVSPWIGSSVKDPLVQCLFLMALVPLLCACCWGSWLWARELIFQPIYQCVFGGPPLALDLGLFGTVVFDPLSMMSLFGGCSTYRSSISRWYRESLFPKWNFSYKVQSHLLQVTSSCTVCCIQRHVSHSLLDISDLSTSSTHTSLQRNSAFWYEDLFVNVHNLSL